MSVISGKDGNLTIDGVQACPVTNIRLAKTSDNQVYCANDTGGRNRRVPGVKDASGSFHVNDTVCPVDEGDVVTIVVHNGSGLNNETIDAIIDKIEEEIDITGGGIVGWDIDFSGTVVTPVCSSSSST